MDIALFDFDHTLTRSDSFTAFLKFATPTSRLRVGQVVLLPLVLAYKRGWLSASRLRQIAVKLAFKGREQETLLSLGQAFCKERIPAMLMPHAMEKLRWHQQRGDAVFVVSASLDLYLQPWCEALGVTLLCSQLEWQQGRSNGRYRGADCCAQEKANRVKAETDLSQFNNVFAYGDSQEDLAMLQLANRKFYNWQEI